MNSVQYFAPKSISEALNLLDEYGIKATILAGGTDVVTNMHDGKLRPEVIIYIGNIGLDRIEERGDYIALGALTKIAEIANSTLLKKKVPFLSKAASELGNPMTRNKGTVGGNVVGASPAADVAGCIMGLDGGLTLKSVNGERKIKLCDFYKGYRQTAKKDNELLTEIIIPSKNVRGSFFKFGRRKAATCSIVNVSCSILLNDNGKCMNAHIAIGAMGPTIIRAEKAEKLLIGKNINGALIEKAAVEAVKQTQPIDDGRASAWYRKKLAHVLVTKALEQSIS
jgi:CO/xanthine dehydrogenase FAD-binding subunit